MSTAAGTGQSPEETLARLDLDTHLRDPSIKQRYVTVMFDLIARRYDRFTRVFSYGMDAGWKRELLAPMADQTDVRLVVDLACGTGDLAYRSADLLPNTAVLAVDVSRPMVRLARTRRTPCTIGIAAADMTAAPLPDGRADLVTIGYGVRNAPTPDAAITEAARLLRPGGHLCVLDFYRPRNRLWRTLFLWYLRVTGNLFGWLWHGVPAAYGYIAPSIRGYLTAADFTAALERHGFEVVDVRRKLFGGVALHRARRR